MSRFRLKTFALNLAALGLLGTVFTGCHIVGLNNPFNPSAELRVLDVKAAEQEGDQGGLGGFVGIRQSASTADGVSFTLYTYTDPIVTLQNREGLPDVDLETFSVEVKLSDGTNLPAKVYPLSKAVIAGEETDVQFPILSIDTDVRDVVYPGNNAPRVNDGIAKVQLNGVDTNGHDIKVNFNVPLRFESLIYPTTQTPPELAPSPSPSPSPSANTTGG